MGYLWPVGNEGGGGDGGGGKDGGGSEMAAMTMAVSGAMVVRKSNQRATAGGSEAVSAQRYLV